MSSPPSVNIARLTYLLVCEAAGAVIALSIDAPIGIGLLVGLGVAAFFIWMETLMKGFTLRGLSTATFGLGVGLFCAWLLTRVQVSSVLELAFRGQLNQYPASVTDSLLLALDVTLYASLGFVGAVLALRSNRDEFAFIIPYVRFRQDASSGQPVILDVEAVIDGRAPLILRAGFLNGRLIVPRFVLEELQTMAGSAANGERQRGQRGLDRLDQMQKSPEILITIHDSRIAMEENSPHTRLIETARLLGARVMTVDENLTKVAKLQGIDVLNIVELDEALKPSAAVGEKVRLTLVRPGKESHQAVGYLPNGTMIVVNNAAEKIGSLVEATVVSTLQTNAGMMVFAELNE